MAPHNRSAYSLNKLLLAIIYFIALAAWNWICSQHYHIQEQASARRHENLAGSTSEKLRVPKAVAPSVELRTEDAIAPAVIATAAAATTAAKTTATDSPSSCPNTRRPYHTLLTTQATTYQQWQSRIMYYHFLKQKRLDGACTEMTGFTRLVASERAEADGLENEMPSVFVRQYTTAEIAQYGHFGVLNRPFSVVQFIDQGGLERLPEEFIYIAETDHVLMKPLPNLATEKKAAAFAFGYMHASYGHQALIDRFAPGVSYRNVQPVGPSPLIIHKPALRKLAPLWLNMSLRLKVDKEADSRFGWVLEMWGYSIAAAQLGITHEVVHTFQVEGGAGISAKSAMDRGTYIFHYTYGIEYTLTGQRQGVNQIGEWSLDKRHYGAAYPPKNLQKPPEGASDGAVWLLDAFNEASANIPTWPSTKAIGTVGWRRVAGDGVSRSSLAKSVQGTKWTWAGIPGMSFDAGGHLTTPWGKGVWGCLPTGVDYNDNGFCKSGCLFADFGSALHNLKFDTSTEPWSFDSYRVGDGAHVPGVRKE